MCTVSWAHRPGGYHLLCNRDEKRTRGTACAPQLMNRGGVRYIAPIDPDAGGTWIAVNEFGLALCLLNGVAPPNPGHPQRSRGLLVQELAWAASASDCISCAKRMDLRQYGSFSLVVLEPEKPATLAQWDGTELAVDPTGDAHMPLTSSSFDPSGVRRSRVKDFARRVDARRPIDPALLYWFHASHGESPDAYSTCMHRKDAETVSFSWVVVTHDEIRFLYLPCAPCQCQRSEQRILVRAA